MNTNHSPSNATRSCSRRIPTDSLVGLSVAALLARSVPSNMYATTGIQLPQHNEGTGNRARLDIVPGRQRLIALIDEAMDIVSKDVNRT